MRRTLVVVLAALVLPAAGVAQQKAAPMSAAAKIANAMAAAPASVAAHATIMDWPASPKAQPSLLRAGNNGWICYPRMPSGGDNNPMCLDGTWQKTMAAMMAHKPPPAASFGVSYMIAGGDSGSNTDPYASKATPTNEWGYDGPHVMLLLPASALQGLPTKRTTTGPYVMWRGTPYVHVMLPIAAK